MDGTPRTTVPERAYVVTGASSGIGRATARALARPGTGLVLVSRSGGVLDEVAAECEAAGARCLVCEADVRAPETVEAAFTAARGHFGRIDGVVHSAAVLAYGAFEQVPPDIFETTIETTLMGTVTVARTALRHFREQGSGQLVVIGSLLGSTALPYLSAYVTAKWGVHGLVRTLQLETQDEPGIDVTLVTPGAVDTPIYRQAATYVGRHGRPLPPTQRTEKVAERVLAALDRPRREVPSGPVNGLFTWFFRTTPGLYDRVMPHVVQRLGLTRETTPATSGNVLHPRPHREAVAGPPTAPALTTRGTTMSSSNPPSPADREDTEPERRPGPKVSRDVEAPAEAVWQVLADGWSYPTWVVGASRVRDVDDSWPEVGARIHHAFGPWPAVIQDYTVVEEMTPGRRLVLKARGWPVGEARVVITVEPSGPDQCRVTMAEDAIKGPGTLVPHPFRQVLIVPRNREALYRVALLAEGQHRQGQHGKAERRKGERPEGPVKGS